MKENNLEELIDGYLRNTLTNDDQKRLREITAGDPVAASLLKESMETDRFILHLRYKKIKRALEAYDQQQLLPRQTSLYKQVFIAASLLLIALAGSYLLASYSCSPKLVAERNFIPVTQDQVRSENFSSAKDAEEYFRLGQYQNATVAYASIQDAMDETSTSRVRWNFLLCRLAMEGPTPTWKKDMLLFISHADADLQQKGMHMLRLYDSILYRLASILSQRKFSPIKPRLI